MGFFEKIFGWLKVKHKETNVICIGLDNSGKTTIINQLKPEMERNKTIVPTVGFKVQKFIMSNIDFTVFDMSGQGRYRNMWEHYYREAKGIIFVIDSSDKIRMSVAKDELDQLLKHPDINSKRIPIMFFANKMDIQNSLTAVQCSQLLGLDLIKEKPWHICGTNGVTGEGIAEGIEWLSGQLQLTT